MYEASIVFVKKWKSSSDKVCIWSHLCLIKETDNWNNVEKLKMEDINVKKLKMEAPIH
jgi:hypothetical protein